MMRWPRARGAAITIEWLVNLASRSTLPAISDPVPREMRSGPPAAPALIHPSVPRRAQVNRVQVSVVSPRRSTQYAHQPAISQDEADAIATKLDLDASFCVVWWINGHEGGPQALIQPVRLPEEPEH